MKKNIPNHTQPLMQSIIKLGELYESFDTIVVGLSFLKFDPILSKWVSSTPLEDEIDETELSRKADKLASEGFTLFVSQMLLSVCSVLEACVYDSCASWLVDTKFKTATDELRNIKISFGEFQNLTNDERARYLVEAITYKGGGVNTLGKFERVFESVGWPKYPSNYDLYEECKISKEDIYKKLTELFCFRNLYLHKNGIIDRKNENVFIERGLKYGDQILPTTNDLVIYLNTSVMFLLSVILRSQDMEEVEEEMKKAVIMFAQEIVEARQRNL